MSDPSHDTTLLLPVIGVAGQAAAYPAGTWMLPGLGASVRDWRLVADTTGTVAANNRVMFRAQPTDPEAPFPGARVRLHRLADGYCAWQGVSDAQGYYWADGLEVGVEYYPIAIDLPGQFEVVAAGPVVATRAEA